MNSLGTPYCFDAREISPPGTPEDKDAEIYREATLEALHKISLILRDFLCFRPDGTPRLARTIPPRAFVMLAILNPETSRSYAAEARRLGCTRAHLCKIASEFTAMTGLHTPGGERRSNADIRNAQNDCAAKSDTNSDATQTQTRNESTVETLPLAQPEKTKKIARKKRTRPLTQPRRPFTRAELLVLLPASFRSPQ